ncbi:hypothetical protein [Dyella sp. Tek66A03]|uniref:hypothetical protein n=1 Tax=Dyella sp. Tek66A03 TaxID=3458298 RepID=UPI00403E60BB
MNIDTAEFPIVWMVADPALNVPMEETIASFSELLSRNQPFVFVGEGEPGDGDTDNVEDRRKITLWMKANKNEIRRLVKGHVQIVTDTAKRAAMEAFSVVFGKFWGYPMHIVAGAEEAHTKAQSLLDDA